MPAVSSKFLEDLLSKLPAEARSSVETIFTSPEAAEAVKFAENGAKRQADYSRGMNELQAKTAETERLHEQALATHEAQKAWWEAQQPVLEAGRKALEGGTGTPPAQQPKPAELPADVVRRADLEKEINAREMGAVAFITATTQLAMQHQQQFGEVLDIGQIVAEAGAKKLPLAEAYRAHYADKLAEKANATETARINGLVEARLVEERKKFTTSPYPVAVNDLSPSPLDALTPTDPAQKPDPSQYSVQAAADEYLQLAARRTG